MLNAEILRKRERTRSHHALAKGKGRAGWMAAKTRPGWSCQQLSMLLSERGNDATPAREWRGRVTVSARPVLAPLHQHAREHALDVAVIEGVAFGNFAGIDQAADDELVVCGELEHALPLALTGARASLTGAGEGEASRQWIEALSD